MPLYDRICEDCSTVENDLRESMDEASKLVECPNCSGRMHRMMPTTQRPQGGDTPVHVTRGVK